MDHSSMYVGLDYHLNSVQVCVIDAQGKQHLNKRTDNSWAAIADTVHHCVGFDTPICAAIESTPGAADLAEELVKHAQWSTHLAHARYVAKLKQSPDKTDFSDARLLADLTRVGYLPRVWLPPLWVRELRQLVNHRQQLADRSRSIKQRTGAILREHRVTLEHKGSRWTLGWQACLTRALHQLPDASAWMIREHLEELAYLKKRIKAAEDRLRETIAHDVLTQRLLDEPGVGLVTAVALRAAVGRFDRFANGKSLSRYCGLSPRNASSGNRQADAGLINEANRKLRAVLIELAWRLMRCVPRWKAMALHLRSRGKASCVVAAAVANRWVRQLHHQYKEMGLS